MLRAVADGRHPSPGRHVRRRYGGAVMLLPIIVFLFVTGLIIGVVYFVAGAGGAERRQIDRRLREVSLGPITSDPAAADSTVVKRVVEGPLPAVDRFLS